MKKQKQVKPYYFTDKSHKAIVEELNNKYPVTLKYNLDLINRVHEKYPYINKLQLIIIATKAFETLRELIVLGNVINFNKIFFDMKLFFFKRETFGYILPLVKLILKTPPVIKKRK